MQHQNLKSALAWLSVTVIIASALLIVGPTAYGAKTHLDVRPPHPAMDVREESPAASEPLITAPGSPTAATIYVRPGGDDTLCSGTVDVDYSAGIEPNCAVKTIQKGIDLVDSAGVVHIAAGTYVENVRANKPVELAGAGEAATVILPAVSLPNPCTGSSLCGTATAASNIILVEASNVTIHNMTLDGDNPGLTSGIVRGGADLDARNGIIENFYAGVFNQLQIYDVTIKNIYLRGVYFSSGGSNFTIHDSTVQNVQGDAYSIAIFNFGGSGTIANNAVSDANDAIAANHSRGTQFLSNTVTGSASGVHTDNAGDGGGAADLIQDNSVSNCSTDGYGVWVFVPYLAPTVNRNTVTNCAVGLSAWGQGAAVTTSFTNNVINGPVMAANSVGVYVTTDLISWGYTDVAVEFRNNLISGNDTGIYLTADQQPWNPEPFVAKTVSALFYDNSIQGNATQMSLGTQGTYLPDASANWWGSNTPGVVKTAANNGSLVDYTPWLASGSDTSPNPGFQGDFTTLWVDDDSPQFGSVGRIQEGVDLVSGSTVQVAAGTYVEAGILLDSAVALLGAGSGPSGTIIDATSLATTGNVVTINTSAGDVTVDGFRILTGQNLNGIYAKATSAASTVTIAHNYIEGWKSTANPTRVCSGDNFDLIAGYGSQASLVFQYNDLLQGCSNAILLERWLGPTDVSYNSWDRGVKDTATDGYFNMNYGGPDIATLQKVSHNTIDLGGGTMFTNNERSTGITFAAAYTGAPGGYTQVEITDNTITNLRPYRRGIGLWNNAPSPGTGADIANALISGNTITGMPGNTGSIGIRLLGLASNAVVSGNDIDQVDMVFQGRAWNGHIATGAVVNQNNFSQSITGFDWQGVALLNAETNWWGSPCGPSGAGPGNGIPVSANVDFNPWWTAVNGPGTASYVGSEYIVPTGSTTPQIQAILDCAGPGSVVKFESGSYPGGLVVNNSGVTIKLNSCTIGHGSPAFTIVGNDVTISGPGALDGNGDPSPGILVQNAGNFTLQNAEVREWLDGIQVIGNVTSLKVTGNWIHDNADTGLQVDGTPVGVITIKGNLFKNNTGDGVLYNGTGSLSAAYNSWGDLDGPNVGAGDGADAAKVSFVPWTFAELFMDMDPPTNAVTRSVVETISFNVELKADAAKLYGMSFQITFDPARLTLNTTTFMAPWAGACTSLSVAPGTIRYRCNLQIPTAEYDAVGGTIATFNFTALMGPPGNGPWPTYFNVASNPADTSTGAIGGVRVYVNNAGFGAPSAPARDITDINDGEIIVIGLANFTGFVDLEGDNNDGGATLTVLNQKPKLGSVALANGTSAASGAYATSYINPNWLLVGSTYWLQFDAPLHLPTTTMAGSVTYPTVPTDWSNGALLTTRPTTALIFVKLLGGDATNNDVVDIFDAGCIGAEYENPSFSTCSGVPGTSPDVVVDGTVNIFDLVLMGSNYELTYSPWSQLPPP